MRQVSLFEVFFCMMITVWGQELMASCERALEQAQVGLGAPLVVVLFDGLGTNEMGSKLLLRDLGSKIQERCEHENLHFVHFHYGKAGARRALDCLQAFKQNFDQEVSFQAIGHSFGAGKGVMNLLDISRGKIQFDNVLTFDPRGDSYRYKNPGRSQVTRFINVYQSLPLAGRPVAGADQEIFAGPSGHMSLPRKKGDEALRFVVGRLSCARP